MPRSLLLLSFLLPIAIGCVREGELVPIEVSPRLAARMAYVGALPSRTHAKLGEPAEGAEAGEEAEESEAPEAVNAPESSENRVPNMPSPHGTPVKTLAGDGGAD